MFWKIIGVLLLIWVAWDLYAGYTFLTHWVSHAAEPGLYWTGIAIWTTLGISCFFSWKK